MKETSASYDGNNVRREAIHANHMDMVRFSSKDDEGYKRTLHHIIDICESHEYQFRQSMLLFHWRPFTQVSLNCINFLSKRMGIVKDPLELVLWGYCALPYFCILNSYHD